MRADRSRADTRLRPYVRGRADLPHRDRGRPGHGALRQGRHGLALEPALALLRRLPGS